MVDARFRRLAAATAVGTFALLLAGAYTKAIGAGLACPDWPTCYGTLVPFLHPATMAESPYTAHQVFAEWFHRTLAAVVGVLVVWTAVEGWRGGDLDRPEVGALVAAVLLPVQVVLGGLTVTEHLDPVVVTAHLGTAVLIFAGILVAATGRRTGARSG